MKYRIRCVNYNYLGYNYCIEYKENGWFKDWKPVRGVFKTLDEAKFRLSNLVLEHKLKQEKEASDTLKEGVVLELNGEDLLSEERVNMCGCNSKQLCNYHKTIEEHQTYFKEVKHE